MSATKFSHLLLKSFWDWLYQLERKQIESKQGQKRCCQDKMVLHSKKLVKDVVMGKGANMAKGKWSLVTGKGSVSRRKEGHMRRSDHGWSRCGQGWRRWCYALLLLEQGVLWVLPMLWAALLFSEAGGDCGTCCLLAESPKERERERDCH